MRKIVMFIVVLALATTLHAAVVGWNNDGSGDYGRDCKPPLSFDGVKGTSIQWKAPMPNWSNSSPIVIEPADGKGPVRVICVSEPIDYSPILLCFDADTGKELWRQELDAVSAMPKEQQDEARALAKKCYAWHRAWAALNADAQKLYMEHKADWSARADLKPVDTRFFKGYPEETLQKLPVELAPLIQRGKDIDCVFAGFGFTHWTPSIFQPPNGSKTNQEQNRLAALGLQWDAWANEGTWNGITYPTPISDGKYIYTLTGQFLYSCHDLDGNLIWQSRFSPPKASDLTPEQAKRFPKNKGRINWPNGSWNVGSFSTTLLLADGLLVSNAACMIRALDANTGQTKWWAPATSGSIGQNMANPMIATVGGEKYILTVGGEGRITPEGDAILRLRDGVEVGFVPGINAEKCGNTGPVLIAPDLVLTHGTGSALLINQLIPTDGRITTKEVWNYTRKWVGGKCNDIGLWRPAWRDGKLYQGGNVLDAVSKTFPAIGQPAMNGGYCGGGNILAGDYCLTWNFYEGKFLWRNIITNKKAGEGSLPTNPPDGLSEQLKKEHEMGSGWKWLGTATPFAYKDRLYVRTNDFLWCIGPAVKGTSQDDPKAAETIRALTKVDDLLPYLDKPSALERYEATLALGKLGPKAVPAIAKLTTLVKEDLYEEIRAAAVIALDAVDPAGKPGTAALQVMVASSPGVEFLGPCLLGTLSILGPERAGTAVIPLLRSDLASKEGGGWNNYYGGFSRGEGIRLTAVRALCEARLFNPQVNAALVETLTTDQPERVVRHAARAISQSPGDPALAGSMRNAIPKIQNTEAAQAVLGYVAQNLPEAERVPFLKTMITGGSRHRDKALEILRQLAGDTNKTLADEAAVELKAIETTKP